MIPRAPEPSPVIWQAILAGTAVLLAIVVLVLVL